MYLAWRSHICACALCCPGRRQSSSDMWGCGRGRNGVDGMESVWGQLVQSNCTSQCGLNSFCSQNNAELNRRPYFACWLALISKQIVRPSVFEFVIIYKSLQNIPFWALGSFRLTILLLPEQTKYVSYFLAPTPLDPLFGNNWIKQLQKRCTGHGRPFVPTQNPCIHIPIRFRNLATIRLPPVH